MRLRRKNRDSNAPAQTPKKRPVAPSMPRYWTKAPGDLQYLVPMYSPLGPPPQSMMMPRMIKPTMVSTLMMANLRERRVSNGVGREGRKESGREERGRLQTRERERAAVTEERTVAHQNSASP